MATSRTTTPPMRSRRRTPPPWPCGRLASRAAGLATFTLAILLLFLPGAWILPSLLVALLGSAAAAARPGDAANAACCLLLHAGFVAVLGRGATGPGELAACLVCAALALLPLYALRAAREGGVAGVVTA